MPILHIKSDPQSIELALNEALVDACQKVDTGILFGCRDGACGACLVRVLENPSNLSSMEDIERDFLETMQAQPGERLACQCRILGDVTIEVAE